MPALTRPQLESLNAAILALDPEQQYVEIDIDRRVVRYCDEIIQHEAISSYVGDEEPVRAYYIAWLCTEGGYAPAAIELEKRYAFGRASHSELDIRVRREDANDEAFALIELKAPSDWIGVEDSRIEGQLFAMAGSDVRTEVLALGTADIGADGTVVVRAVVIAYENALSYGSWRDGGRPHVEDLPVSYNQPLPEPLVNDAATGLRTDVTSVELDRIRKKLHNRLWGGSRDDNQIYAWLVRLLLTKIHDEKTTNEGDPYTFQLLHHGAKPETVEETAVRIDAAYLEAYRRYIDDSATTVESLAAGLFGASEVQWVVRMLQGISISAAGQASGDLLGSFFEAITRDGFKQSKGLFFTHYNVAIFMLSVLEVAELAEEKLSGSAHPNDRLPYIIDPSAGSGTFLLAAMRTITAHVLAKKSSLARNSETSEQLALRFPDLAPNTWAKDFIYGIEKREDLTMSSKVNMVLHRDGHTRIYADDGLAPLDRIAGRHSAERLRAHDDPDGIYTKKVSEAFDVVVTNPPFSIELDGTTSATLSSHFELANQRNSENMFLERWYQLLKHGGRLGAVLPESFFSTAENHSARMFLLRHFDIRAVVSLPSHTFQPWTPTRTSLLFARKKSVADELAWMRAWNEQLSQSRQISTKARKAAKKLLSPPDAGLSDAARAAAVGEIGAWVGRIGLSPVNESGTNEWVREVEMTWTPVRVEHDALKHTLDAVADDDYFGLSVDEVGYRRTKRAESDRRNDLFVAVVNAGTSSERRVRNLNLQPDGWTFSLSNDGSDALSFLRAKAIWD